MIYGIGTDLVVIDRLRRLWQRYGSRIAEKILAVSEYEDLAAVNDPGRLLAKRFAAKEAFAKALGTGIRAPVLLPAIAVSHDPHGRPSLHFAPELAAFLAPYRVNCHLSISDEHRPGGDLAIAFVVLERQYRAPVLG